jgi:hypothetical protein
MLGDLCRIFPCCIARGVSKKSKMALGGEEKESKMDIEKPATDSTDQVEPITLESIL